MGLVPFFLRNLFKRFFTGKKALLLVLWISLLTYHLKNVFVNNDNGNIISNLQLQHTELTTIQTKEQLLKKLKNSVSTIFQSSQKFLGIGYLAFECFGELCSNTGQFMFLIIYYILFPKIIIPLITFLQLLWVQSDWKTRLFALAIIALLICLAKLKRIEFQLLLFNFLLFLRIYTAVLSRWAKYVPNSLASIEANFSKILGLLWIFIDNIFEILTHPATSTFLLSFFLLRNTDLFSTLFSEILRFVLEPNNNKPSRHAMVVSQELCDQDNSASNNENKDNYYNDDNNDNNDNNVNNDNDNNNDNNDNDHNDNNNADNNDNSNDNNNDRKIAEPEDNYTPEDSVNGNENLMIENDKNVSIYSGEDYYYKRYGYMYELCRHIEYGYFLVGIFLIPQSVFLLSRLPSMVTWIIQSNPIIQFGVTILIDNVIFGKVFELARICWKPGYKKKEKVDNNNNTNNNNNNNMTITPVLSMSWKYRETQIVDVLNSMIQYSTGYSLLSFEDTNIPPTNTALKVIQYDNNNNSKDSNNVYSRARLFDVYYNSCKKVKKSLWSKILYSIYVKVEKLIPWSPSLILKAIYNTILQNSESISEKTNNKAIRGFFRGIIIGLKVSAKLKTLLCLWGWRSLICIFILPLPNIIVKIFIFYFVYVQPIIDSILFLIFTPRKHNLCFHPLLMFLRWNILNQDVKQDTQKVKFWDRFRKKIPKNNNNPIQNYQKELTNFLETEFQLILYLFLQYLIISCGLSYLYSWLNYEFEFGSNIPILSIVRNFIYFSPFSLHVKLLFVLTTQAFINRTAAHITGTLYSYSARRLFLQTS